MSLADPVDWHITGFPVLPHHPEFVQVHVHWVGDALYPSHPLSSPSSPALSLSQQQGLFQMSQLFASGGQSIGASVWVLPMNVLGWFPLGLTGLISLKSKGLSSLLQHHDLKSSKSLTLSFLYDPTCTSVHDYWKNHSFDYTDLCWQSDVSAF